MDNPMFSIIIIIALVLSMLLNMLFIEVIKTLNSKVKSLKPRYKLTKKQFKKLDFNSKSLEMIDSLDGIQFEDLCCEILAKLGYTKIHKTNITGDFGLDIICTKDGKRYGIQCKCYSSAVGISAIEEAFAGAAYYRCDVPIVMSNEYFTDAAQEMARVIGVTLWSRHFFMQVLKDLKKKNFVK